jgi:hypothetical protein
MSRLIKLGIASILLFCSVFVRAQDADLPLGDVARSYRKSSSDSRPVIDNDNLPVVMDKAEAARLNSKPVFSTQRQRRSSPHTTPPAVFPSTNWIASMEQLRFTMAFSKCNYTIAANGI